MAETSSDPDVSIVIVAHSVRNELERCLGSIRDFAELPLETILVDNASTDDTVVWVRRNHPAVRLIELDHNLFGAARNHALPIAAGRYVLFIDSDAHLTSGALKTMVSALDANHAWGLLGPRLVYPDGTLQLSCRRFPPLTLPLIRRPPLRPLLERSRSVRRHLMEDVDHGRPRPVPYVLGACQLFRRSLATQLGALDPGLSWGGEDIDWCIRIWDAGSEVIYFPDATVVHRYRRASSAAPLSRTAWRHLRSFARLQRKYRHRRRELKRLATDLDRRAAAQLERDRQNEVSTPEPT